MAPAFTSSWPAGVLCFPAAPPRNGSLWTDSYHFPQKENVVGWSGVRASTTKCSGQSVHMGSPEILGLVNSLGSLLQILRALGFHPWHSLSQTYSVPNTFFHVIIANWIFVKQHGKKNKALFSKQILKAPKTSSWQSSLKEKGKKSI